MDYVAIAVMLIFGPWLFFQQRRLERSVFRAGYSAGRLAEFLKRPRPQSDEDWNIAMKPVSPTEIIGLLQTARDPVAHAIEQRLKKEAEAEVEGILKK